MVVAVPWTAGDGVGGGVGVSAVAGIGVAVGVSVAVAVRVLVEVAVGLPPSAVAAAPSAPPSHQELRGFAGRIATTTRLREFKSGAPGETRNPAQGLGSH
jgi:hypothetical protein